MKQAAATSLLAGTACVFGIFWEDHEWTVAIILLVLTVALMLPVTLLTIARRGLLHPLSFAGLMLCLHYAIVPFIHVVTATTDTEIWLSMTPELFGRTQGLAFVACLSFLIAYWAFPQRWDSSTLAQRLNEVRIDPSRASKAIVVLLGLAIVAFVYFVQALGGLAVLLEQRKGLSGDNLGYVAIVKDLGLVACALYIVTNAHELRTSTKPLLGTMAMVTLAMTLQWVDFSRASLFIAPVQAAILLQLIGRKIPKTVLALGAALFVLAGTMLGQYRGMSVEDVYKVTESREASASWVADSIPNITNFITGDFGRFTAASVCIGLTEDSNEYLWGTTYLGSALIFLPSAWFPDKPLGGGGAVYELRYGEGSWNALDKKWSLQPSFLGEALINFGVPGVIVAFVLLGGFTKWAVAMYRTPMSPAVALLYLCLIYYVYFLLVQAGTDVFAVGFGRFVVPLFVVIAMIRVATRRVAVMRPALT